MNKLLFIIVPPRELLISGRQTIYCTQVFAEKHFSMEDSCVVVGQMDISKIVVIKYI